MEKVNFFKLANFFSKQKIFLEYAKNYRYVLLSGAVGTGKSKALRWTLLYLLLKHGKKYPGIQAGLFCNTYPELNDRHLKYIRFEFPEWLGTYYEQRKEFHLNLEYGGGILMFRNLDDIEKYRCFSEDTEVLVRGKGFIPISKVKIGDFCLSLNPETREMLWQRVVETYEYDYEGYMVDFFSRFGVSFCVTPNHRMLIRTVRRKKLFFVKAKDLPKRFLVPRTGNWKGKLGLPEKIIFSSNGNNGKKIEFTLENFLRFLGWYLSEGNISKSRFEIKITQLKKENLKKISEILTEANINWHYNKHSFCFNNKALYEYLLQFGKSYQKFIPQEIKDLPPKYLKIFFEALMSGDGTKYSDKKYVFVTTSPYLRDDVTEIALKLGFSITCYDIPHRSRIFPGGTRAYITRPAFHLTINKRTADAYCDFNRKGRSNSKKTNWDYVFYKGKVYCPCVPPFHNILIRHRGRTMFCGQSAEFAFIGVDELTQIPKETFDLLLERNRWKDFKDVRFLAATNPVGPYKHWVRSFFIEKTSSDLRCKDSEVVYLKAGDNPYLPESYYEELARGMDEKMRKALIDGDWYALDDVVDTSGYLNLLTYNELQNAIIDHDYIFQNPSVLGVDPGAGGDETAIVIRDNFSAKILFNKRLSDTMQILPLISTFSSQNKLVSIVIDTTGIGKGVYDRLTEIGFKTLSVQFGEKSNYSSQFFNKKAELFWKMREWILQGGRLLKNEEWDELLQVKYKILSDRVIKIQPKEELLRKGIKSPNVADALALTFAEDLSAINIFDNLGILNYNE